MDVKADKQLQLKQDPATVWKLMTNPTQLVALVPGAELTEQLNERNFKGKISTKIGPVTAKFNGDATFTKLEESNYELILEGKGSDTGGKGLASMIISIQLTPKEDGSTEMNSSMKLSITGKLAQFGSRMIVAVNNKMFDQWAKNFIAQLDKESNPDTDENKDLKPVSATGPEPVEVLPLAWTAVKGFFGVKD